MEYRYKLKPFTYHIVAMNSVPRNVIPLRNQNQEPVTITRVAHEDAWGLKWKAQVKKCLCIST